MRGGAPHSLYPPFKSLDKIDDLQNQQAYISVTKISPWHPKMATVQDFVKNAMNEIIGAGVGREGFYLPHLQGWQGHPSILPHPKATKYPLNPLSLLALKLRLPDLPLLNLQLLSIHLLDLMDCSGGGVNTDLEKTNSINSME